MGAKENPRLLAEDFFCSTSNYSGEDKTPTQLICCLFCVVWLVLGLDKVFWWLFGWAGWGSGGGAAAAGVIAAGASSMVVLVLISIVVVMGVTVFVVVGVGVMKEREETTFARVTGPGGGGQRNSN
jgi:hypothetical protein